MTIIGDAERRRDVAGREFENWLGQLMKLDLAAGTEAFRDELLVRCLDVLCSDSVGDHDADERFRAYELSDDDLDLLAAAGEPTLPQTGQPFGDNTHKKD